MSSRRGRIYATTAACDKDAIGCRGIAHLSVTKAPPLKRTKNEIAAGKANSILINVTKYSVL